MHNFYRCFDRYQKPMAAIAIFTGSDARRMPGSYEYSFMKTRLQYQYNTLSILDYSDKELGESNNPFAWVVLAAKKALLKGKDLDKKLLEGKLFIFRKLYENGVFEKRKLQAILTFLNNYIRFENSETYRIFEEETDKITGKQNTMDIFEQVEEMRWQEGLEKGRKEGRAAEKKNTVLVLLANTKLSVEKIAIAVGVSTEVVKKLKKELHAH